METTKCNNCQTDNLINSKYCKSCGYELPKIQAQNSEEIIGADVDIKKKKRSEKITATIVGTVVFFLTYYAVQYFFFQPPSYDKAMMSAASEINKTCPVMVDAETRLDNTIALPGNVFQYNYTLVKIDKANADTLSMKNYLEPTITNVVKTNPQMKFQRDHNTTMNYYYKDKNGLYLFIVTVTPNKYK